MSSVSLETWRRAEVVFETALDHSPEHREALILRVCGSDRELRSAVDSLLAFATESPEPANAGAGPRRPRLPQAPMSPWCGRQVGRYRIQRPIGVGGMGEVFLAERVGLEIEQRVAVKLIRESRPTALRRFRRERQILARLEHPNIARFLDGGITEEGTLYVVLEYVDGTALTDYCDARRLGVEQRLALFAKVCRAVQHAHQNLIVHCDLKPGNILVGNDGEPKLLDFGIARLLDWPLASEASETMGASQPTTDHHYLTPVYASPEQRLGLPLTMATDIYSLGVLLYELLSGRLPPANRATSAGDTKFVAAPRPSSEWTVKRQGEPTADQQTTAAARATTPRRLRRRLLGDLDNIVRRSLCADPSQRYSSVDRLVEDVRHHLSGLPIHAQPPRLGYRFDKFVRRHRFAVTATILALLALSALGLNTMRRSEEVARERDLALRAQREAEQVTRFLTDAFRLASAYHQEDPGPSVEDGVTVRQALDYSAGRVGREFADQPVLRARLLSTIGRVYIDLGQVDQAVELLRKTLAIRREVLADGHPERIDSLNGLGWALLQQGQVGEAEITLRTALSASRALPGPSHYLADSLSYLGDLLLKRGDPAAAVPLLAEALRVGREIEQPSSRRVAEALTNLGAGLRSQGDLDGAASLLEESLAILRRVAGEQHPEVASVMHTLGWVSARQGHADQAVEMLQQALSISQQTLGFEHPETLAHLASWGDYLTFTGDYAAAQPILHQVLERDRAIKGAQHPDVAHDLNALALTLWQQGELHAAEPHLHEALDIARLHWGRDSKRTATFLHNLGTLRSELGRPRMARPILEEALEIRTRLLGPTHTDIGITLTVLADLHARQERFEQALAIASEAVTLLTSALSEKHWRTAIAQSVRADCLTGLGQYAEAEKLLVDAVPRIEVARGSDSRTARSARQRLERLAAARARTQAQAQARTKARTPTPAPPFS